MERRTLPKAKNKLKAFQALFVFLGLVFVYKPAQAQECPLTCIEQVNVSLAGDCMRTITIDDVLQGMPDTCTYEPIVTLVYPFPDHYNNLYPDMNKVDGTLRNYRLTYRVTDTATGNWCWGYLIVEDKYPPQIMCEDDTVTCFEESLIGLPVVTDNCSYPAIVDIVKRQWVEYDCEEALETGFVGIVNRTLIAYDVWGNSKQCEQKIWIARTEADSAFVEDFDSIECSYLEVGLKNKTGSKYYNYVREVTQDGKKYLIPIPACINSTGNIGGTTTLDPWSVVSPPALINNGDTTYIWPTDLPTTRNKNFSLCMIYTHFKDHIIPTCGDVYKIRREWKIVDWCAQFDTTLIQYIKILDTEAPVLSGQFNSTATNAKPHDCKGLVTLHWPTVSYDCWRDYTKLRAHYSIEVIDYHNKGKVFFYSDYFPYEDNAAGIPIYLPAGEHEIDWIISDLCGNFVETTETIVIEDVTPPTPFCDEISQVTMDPDECWARVYAKNLDDGSHDNCCYDLHFAVANMDTVEYYRKKWKDEYINNCGEKYYWQNQDEIHELIEAWINCFIFDEYIDVTECGEETLILRVYEACGLHPYDPHVFHGSRHDWFCYQTWEEFAAYYSWNYKKYKQYQDPRPPIRCEYHYGEVIFSGIDWGFPSPCGEAAMNQTQQSQPILECVLAKLGSTVDEQVLRQLAADRWEFDYKYNDCMIQLLKDDKIPPVCEVDPDITIFCDGVPYELTGRYCNVYDKSYTPRTAFDACFGTHSHGAGTNSTIKIEYEHPKHCAVADPFAHHCEFCVNYNNPYDITKKSDPNLQCQVGYYKGPDYDHYGGYDGYKKSDPCGYEVYNGQIYGKGYNFNWRPIYCREWLELDRFDNCDNEKPDPKSYFGPLDYEDNCRIDTVFHEDFEWINECGEGWVQRLWTVRDCQGNETQCSQKVYVKCRSDFEVLFQEDLEVDCTDLNNLKPSKEGGSITTFPQVADDDCELIGISYEDEIFELSVEACYKILRTWTVIDWCKYDPAQYMRYPDVIVDDSKVAGEQRPCVYRHLKDDGDGVVRYTQVIKVFDTEAPEITCTNDTSFCYYGSDCYNVPVLIALGEATDNCSTDEHIKYKYQVNLHGSGSSFVNGNGRILDKKLPVGEHIVTLTATDKCGNSSSCSFDLVIEDCKPPTPFCYSGIVSVIMPTSGEVRVWATDLVEKVEDNCTRPWPDFEDIHISFDAAGLITYVDLDCSNKGSVTLQVYVTDEAGNQDFCETYILIQDNQKVCPDIAGASISGNVNTEMAEEVESVQVALKTSNSKAHPSFMTGVDGFFNFFNVPMNYDYSLTAYRNDNPLNGVSTFDLVLMQKHILGIQPITSPYKLIAADVNRSNSITALDIVELRKVILGINDELPNNYSWRFIPKNYSFFNPSQPWNYHEAIEVRNLNHEMTDANFVGIKIGDINDSNTPHSLANAQIRNIQGNLKFVVSDQILRKGQILEIPFKAENFNDISGYQFTLDLPGVEIVGINSGAIEISEDNFGLHHLSNGYVTASWHNGVGQNVKDGEVLFTIEVKVEENIQLSRIMRIHSAVLNAEAYFGVGDIYQLSLQYESMEDEFVLYQNTPNPFDASTTIGFNLPEASKITLKVFDVAGKEIHTVEDTFSKGYNEIKLQKRDLTESGILYYQLEANGKTETKKMVLVN